MPCLQIQPQLHLRATYDSAKPVLVGCMKQSYFDRSFTDSVIGYV